MALYTLGQKERLKSRKLIEQVFLEGKKINLPPLRVHFLYIKRAEGEAPSKFGITASRKLFRRAVDRNRIKRIFRECWRLQKHLLDAGIPGGQQLLLFFVYNGKELPQFAAGQTLVSTFITRMKGQH